VPIASIMAVTDFDRPELRPYGTMRHQEEHWQQRIFIAEGEKVVRRLLASPLEVISVLLPPSWLDPLRLELENRPEPLQVYTAEKSLLEQLTGFSMYQGLLAVGRRPESPSLAAAITAMPSPRLFVAVDGLTQAENIGALVRNCVAFGTQTLVVAANSSHPYLRRAVRASMATIFQLPVCDAPDLPAALAELRAAGLRLVAAHPHTQEITLPRVDLTRDTCIVFGSEGYGISTAVLDVCDEHVTIPMPPGVDSLNVGAAAAVFLYEANRQRARY